MLRPPAIAAFPSGCFFFVDEDLPKKDMEQERNLNDSKMQRLIPLEKDYYLDHDDYGGAGGRSDDDDDSVSSEDEVQKMFADIAGVQLPSQRKRQIKDDRGFEADMENELDASFRQHNAEWSVGNAVVSASKEPGECGETSKNTAEKKALSKGTETKKTRKEEDVDPALGLNDQGVDSDEEFEKAEGLKGTDEQDDEKLMYDPEEDDANQDWVDSHRRSYQPEASQHRPLPSSDAVLNCPACMSVLCMDCQRHEIYKTQYRAMFVMNCEVKREELLFQPKSKKRGGAKKRSGDILSTLKSGERLTAGDNPDTIEQIKKTSRPEDLFYPVICTVCKTEVAVYDSDEVYHFFNTLASYA